MVMQLITAFFGSVGFALLFNEKKDKLLLAGLGGLLAWGVYLLAGVAVANDALRYLIASITLTFYAEILARIKKAPATIFLVPATIPLIPGGALYQTMQYAVLQQWNAFANQGLYTLLLAAAIAGGIVCAMTVMQMLLRAVSRVTH
ncbi:MAG: threonine/serine exporter family protein [Oscillospiraceae bacterium]|nr:threonine/serine exporter family protein [Oscillospiraceae bacterium]